MALNLAAQVLICVEVNVIRLLRKKPLTSTKFPFLVASNNYHDLASKELDLVEINDIDQQFYEMLRRATSKKLGIEITISKLRATDGQRLAKI